VAQLKIAVGRLRIQGCSTIKRSSIGATADLSGSIGL
jgi:hypothetical protein